MSQLDQADPRAGADTGSNANPTADADPRAVEALDRLARSVTTPRWVRWVSSLRTDPPAEGSTAEFDGSTRRPSRSQLRAVALGLTVAMLAATLVLARRPDPIDDRMPLTSSTVVVEDVTGAASPAAGPSGGGGVGVDASAVSTPADLLPASPVVVHVAGAVDAPGVVELAAGSRVVDAVRAAGGLRHDADADRLNLAATVEDGLRIVVPVRGEPVPEEIAPTGGGDATAQPGAPGAPGGASVNLNTADQTQLETLPGVGPATATAIIAHRDSNGPFRTVESLIDVRGIGEAKLDAVRDLVTVG